MWGDVWRAAPTARELAAPGLLRVRSEADGGGLSRRGGRGRRRRPVVGQRRLGDGEVLRPGSPRRTSRRAPRRRGSARSARSSSRRASARSRSRSRSPAPPVTAARKAGSAAARALSAARLPSTPKTECRMTPKPAARAAGRSASAAPGAGSRRLHHAEGGADRRSRRGRRLASLATATARALPAARMSSSARSTSLGQRRGGDAVQGVEVEVVGAEAAQARLERGGEERGRQRQRLRRLGAAAAQERAQRRHRLHRRARRRHQRRLEAPRPSAPGGARPTLLQSWTASRGRPCRKRPAISSARPPP